MAVDMVAWAGVAEQLPGNAKRSRGPTWTSTWDPILSREEQGVHLYLQKRPKPLWHTGYQFSLSFISSRCLLLSCTREQAADPLVKTRARTGAAYAANGHSLVLTSSGSW
jgi:hypothetical protein